MNLKARCLGSFGTSKPEKAEDSDHISSSSGDDDVQDGGDGDQLHIATVEGKGEGPVEMGPEGVSGCIQTRPAVNMLNQQPRRVVAKGGVAGGHSGRYDPNRYRLHFESESKEEIERRKRAAKSVPIVPLPEVSSTSPSNTHAHMNLVTIFCDI